MPCQVPIPTFLLWDAQPSFDGKRALREQWLCKDVSTNRNGDKNEAIEVGFCVAGVGYELCFGAADSGSGPTCANGH